MTRHSSLASTAIDRTAEYATKPEVRQRQDFDAKFVSGCALKEDLRIMWVKKMRRRYTKASDYLEAEA